MSLGGCALVALCLAAASASFASPAAASPRIVGGSTTTTAVYPWQAALVLDERFAGNDFQKHFCGGSLITPRIVVTAAHCVTHETDPDDGGFLDLNDANVVLGRTTLSGAGGEEHDLAGIYYHSGYDPVTVENDLAFVVLDSASAQATIKFAGADEGSLWDPGSPTVVSGWGATIQAGAGSDTLRHAVVPVISDAVCGGPLVYGADFFADVMVCAGVLAGGVDSCQGDSGGPLAAPSTTPVFRLVGIVSWGHGCAAVNKPGVYTRVAGVTGPGSSVQGSVDAIEDVEGLPDAGPVFGSGLGGASGGPGQSVVQPPPGATPSASIAGPVLKRCKKLPKPKRRVCRRKQRKAAA